MSDEDDDRLIDEDAALEDEDDEGEDLEDEDAGGKKAVDSSDEEEEEDGQNEYEDDGFVVNEDAEEEEGEEEEDAVGRKKRRKKRKSLKLDEEDYDLLEENDVKVRRPEVGSRKRLKRAGESNHATNAEQMRANLFGDEDLEDELEDEVAEQRRRGDNRGADDGFDDDRQGDRQQEDEDLFMEDDEMGDFIVEEGADVGRARRRRKAALAMPGINSRALEEAADIFGNVDDLLEVYQTTRAMRPDLADEDGHDDVDEDEYLDEDEDEDAAEARRQAKEEGRRNRLLQRAMKVLDPETIARQHLLPADQVIKEKDVPERYQLIGLDPTTEQLDIQTATDWIYERLFSEEAPLSAARTILEDGVMEVDGSNQATMLKNRAGLYGFDKHQSIGDLHGHRFIRERRSASEKRSWQNDASAQAALKEAIKQVLTHVYEKLEEVPLIAMYRKELAGELLAMYKAESSDRDDYHQGPRKDPMDDMPSYTTRQTLQDGPNYRRDIYKPGVVQARDRKLRRYQVLWQVLDFSVRFRKLVKRKAALEKRVEAALEVIKEPEEDVETLAKLLSTLQNDPESWVDESLNDIDARLKLMHEAHAELMLGSLSLGGMQAGGAKKAPPGRGVYKHLMEAGLKEVMCKVLMSSAAFAENLLEVETQPNDIEEPAIDPSEWFEQQLYERALGSHGITSGDELKRRIKLMAIQELIAEPVVRSTLRSAFTEAAKITTTPTHAGETHASMEPWAKYGFVKRIQGKPLSQVGYSDTFLRIVGAAREKLITVELGIEKEKLEGPANMLSQVCKLYCSVNVSAWAKAWNEFRMEVVREAVLKHLFPIFEHEHKQRLLALANDAAIADVEASFWQLAARPPLRIRLPEGDNPGAEVEYVEAPRIMSVVWGEDEKAPTMVVALDERGNLVDLLPCGQMSGNVKKSGKSTNDIFIDSSKSKDIERIRDKILEKVPHAIIVGCGSPQSAQLFEDVTRIRDHLFEEHARILQQLETNHIEVWYADERLAALWENCRAAREEFPEQGAHVRRAIALARLHIDPLSILAQLCGSGREILAFKLTDLQHLLQPEERMKCIEQVLVTAISQVGVDINLAANVAWRRDVLQYVPGLGARKARALLESIQRNGNKVESRNEMYRELGVLGKTVFRNCGSYLFVTSAGLPQLANLEFRQLDASRIHPESYRLAVAVCERAIGEEDVEGAVEEHSDKIECVDLESLAAEKQIPSKLATLIDIQHELLQPGGELRGVLAQLYDKDVFFLQHGEDEETLRVGRLVDAKVTYVGREEVSLRLTQSAIEAVLDRQHISSRSEMTTARLQDYIQKGQNLIARIIDFRLEDGRDGNKHYVITLDARSEALQDVEQWEKKYCLSREIYFKVTTRDEVQAAQARAMARMQKEASVLRPSAVQVMVRPIVHPLFKNVTMRGAGESLSALEVPVGECIIRPAAGEKGANTLCASIKVFHGPKVGAIVQHVDIKEAPKKSGSVNHLHLSTPLTVEVVPASREEDGGMRAAPTRKKDPLTDAMKLEDLDELHAAFVEPLVAKYAEVTAHRKFVDKLISGMDEAVTIEKRAQPHSVPYNIGFDTQKGVSCVITFQAGSKPHHERFTVTPNGFYFRRRVMKSLEHVLALFKKDPYNKDMRDQVGRNTGYTAIDAMQAPGQFMAAAAGHMGGHMGGQGGYAHGMPPPSHNMYQQPYGASQQYGGAPQYAHAQQNVLMPPPPQMASQQQQYYSQGDYNQTQQYNSQGGYGQQYYSQQ